MTTHRSVPISIAIALGLITVLGPASVDMYLPFVPAMADDLNTQYPMMQLTLTVFLFAMGFGQLIFGPIIDTYGRRKPLLIALLIFSSASLWASASMSVETLITARLIQGLAAALALVTAMSTVRDVAEGIQAAQLFALLMTIQGLGPVLAPAAGSIIGATLGWRAVFSALALIGLIVFINSIVNLRETLPIKKRSTLNLSSIVKTYIKIISDRKFLIPGLALVFIFFFLFAYVGGAAYVYQIEYGVTAHDFGFIFGGTGMAVLIGAMSSAKLVTKFRIQSLAFAGAVAVLLGSSVSLISVISGIGFPGIIVGMFIALAGVGMGEATLMSIALASRSTALGASAALLGGFPTMLGAIATPFAATLAEIGAHNWLLFLCASGFIATLLTWASVRIIRLDSITLSH